jgi:hypothetical protein
MMHFMHHSVLLAQWSVEVRSPLTLILFRECTSIYGYVCIRTYIAILESSTSKIFKSLKQI